MLKFGPLCHQLSETFKKLMSVLATSVPVTEASKDEEVALARVPYIHYPLRFRKDTNEVQAFINTDNKVNAMAPAYASKLGLQVRRTNVRA